MLRIILITLVLLLTITGGLAILLFQQFGWQGLLVFPFILIGLGWITKVIVGRLIKNFLLKAFAMKSDVLHLAELTIHSVRSAPKPPAIIDISDDDQDPGPDDSTDPDGDESNDGPKDYFEVELTITPQSKHEDAFWEPSELVLMAKPVTSLLEMEDADTLGTTQQVRIWEEDKFVDDDPGKYPGEQKLLLTFEVIQGTRKAVLQYYNHALGEISFPSPQLAGEIIVDV